MPPTGNPPPMILPMQVRSGVTPVQALGAALGQPQRDDLIENQNDAVAQGRLAQGLEKLRGRRHHAHRSEHWLHDDGGQFIGMLSHQRRCQLGLVVGADHDICQRAGREALIHRRETGASIAPRSLGSGTSETSASSKLPW